ncbi:hypothetical protein NFI96_008446 [Prochilodus magdalenae]|nr:hypothetical protein NFI96_008446 [Prochilodus magdalenae]
MTLPYSQELSVLEGPSQSPDFNPVYISGEPCKWLQPDGALEDLQRGMAESSQIQVCKPCGIIAEKTGGCTLCQRNLTQSARDLDWAGGVPTNKIMTLPYSQELSVLEGPSQSPDFNPVYISGEPCKWLQPDGALEDLQRGMAESSQIQVCKPCGIIAEKTGGCTLCQRCFDSVLGKGSENFSVILWF